MVSNLRLEECLALHVIPSILETHSKKEIEKNISSVSNLQAVEFIADKVSKEFHIPNHSLENPQKECTWFKSGKTSSSWCPVLLPWDMMLHRVRLGTILLNLHVPEYRDPTLPYSHYGVRWPRKSLSGAIRNIRKIVLTAHRPEGLCRNTVWTLKML